MFLNIFHNSKLKSFTLIELLVVVALIAVLIALLLPALGMARENSRQVVCGSNLSQISKGLGFFADEHEDHFPRACYLSSNSTDPKNWTDLWSTRLNEYLSAAAWDPKNSLRNVWACPSFTGVMVNGEEWYGTKGYCPQNKVISPTTSPYCTQRSAISEADRVPLILEWRNYAFASRWYLTIVDAWQGGPLACTLPLVRFDHRGGMNTLFCDSHVAWIPGRPLKWADPAEWCGGQLPGTDNRYWYP